MCLGWEWIHSVEKRMINKLASEFQVDVRLRHVHRVLHKRGRTFVCSARSTAACRRSVTRTTTVPLTRRASSTHTTPRSSLPRPTSSTTETGAGGKPSSLKSSEACSERLENYATTCKMLTNFQTSFFFSKLILLCTMYMCMCVDGSQNSMMLAPNYDRTNDIISRT